MKQKILSVIEQVEMFIANHPVLSQLIMENLDDLIWAIWPMLQSVIQQLNQ